jgi:thiol-disulfide isomerase/thioredoxin
MFMKSISLLLITVFIGLYGCNTSKPVAKVDPESTRTHKTRTNVTSSGVNYSDPSTWILGYFNPDRLKQMPYSAWFTKSYDEYSVNSGALNKLLDISKDNVKIKIIMGTWCSDSRREVPGFMRILDIWKFPILQLSFIGVDNAKNSPVEEYQSLNIQKVPTFIIYKNNIEAGRIIENPLTSLEQDMVNILTRNE